MLSAGVHQIAGGPVLLHRFQWGVVLGHKDSALGGVVRVHLGLALINPGRGGRGQIHHAGVILFPVDGFLFDTVLTAGSSALQTELIDYFNAAYILAFLGPDGHSCIEVFCPMLR